MNDTATTSTQTKDSSAKNNIASEQKLSDENLFNLCKKYGQQARLWRQKFAGLLPEVNRRRLYEKKGFTSIFDFARILASFNEAQVRLVLNLAKSFEDKPFLKSLLEKGEVSLYKLIRVASIATPENEKFWAEKSKILSNRALETLVRDEKIAGQNDNENDWLTENLFKTPAKNDPGKKIMIKTGNIFQTATIQTNVKASQNDSFNAYQNKNVNGLPKPHLETQSLHVQRFETEYTEEKTKITNGQNHNFQSAIGPQPARPLDLLKLKLTQNNLEKILEIQEKGIDINSLIEVMLEQRSQQIATEKEDLAAQIREKNEIPHSKPSRYIPVKIKNLIRQEHGTKCSIPTCSKPSVNIHHTQRYSLTQNHDPYYLAPMCKVHHEIAHNIDQKYQKIRAAGIDSG